MNRHRLSLRKLLGAGVSVGCLMTAVLLVSSHGRADNQPTALPEAKPDIKPDAKSDDHPTLKRKTASSGPLIGGYLGYREIQAELKLTQEEKQKIADAQKWHRQEEEKLYTEYEKKIRDLLGEERWRQLAKLVEKKREESPTKRKTKTTSNEPAKTEEKPPTEKTGTEKPERERERP